MPVYLLIACIWFALTMFCLALVRATTGEIPELVLVPIEIGFGALTVLFMRRVAWTWISMLLITFSSALFFILWGACNSVLIDHELLKLLMLLEEHQHIWLAVLELSEAAAALGIALLMLFHKPVRAWFNAVRPP